MKKSTKKLFSSNSLLLLCTLLLLYFFANSINYSYCIEENSKEYLVPIGRIIQIDGELENLMVRNTPTDSPLKNGDFILEINDICVDDFSDISNIFFSSEENYFKIKIKRKNQIKNILCSKNTLKKISFNDCISGFATLTFINPNDNSFGAVGHSINIGTAKKVSLKNGSISTTTKMNIEKSYKGSVGCINASKKYKIGNFNKNTDFGINGYLNDHSMYRYNKYKIAELEEVKLGKAQIILQNKSDKCEKYDIEILKIYNQTTPSSKTFKIKITDKKLLDNTGGIVQGMSGTPIIQNGMIIGAISHALESNPELGYGIYIRWML